MSVREDEQRKNPNRGLGLAAAAIGVGVGAALYYFFSKRPEHPNSDGSTSQNWNCEHPQSLNGSLSEPSEYSTVSEHTTTDTSVHDSSHTSDNHDSCSTSYDSFINSYDSFTSDHDSFSMISSNSEFERESNTSRSEVNISTNMSIENNESISELNDIIPPRIQVDSIETNQEMNQANEITINEPEIVINETLSEYTLDSDVSINDPLIENDLIDINDFITELTTSEITEPSETSESGFEVTNESTTSRFETSNNTAIATSFDDTDEWDVTNTSLGVPELSDTSRSQNSPLSRIYNSWSNIVSRRTRTKSGRTQQQLTEEEQMAILRQEAFRERSWSLEECSICFEVMLKDQPLMQLPCAHYFHVGCIGPWLQEQQTCPNCRKSAE